jgi:hypothetical protein
VQGKPNSMKNYLIWDFDGTLAYRLGGRPAALLEIIQREALPCKVTADQLRPHLQIGFPWHTPERPHPVVTSADQCRWILLLRSLTTQDCARKFIRPGLGVVSLDKNGRYQSHAEETRCEKSRD